MHEETALSALPEAIPLRSVAPFWRVLAVLALLCAAAFGLGCILLVFAWMADVNGPGPSPPMVMQATPAVPAEADAAADFAIPGGPGDGLGFAPGEGGPAIDPRSVPYPVRADLAATTPPEAGRAARDTAARRFLRLGEDVTKVRKDLALDHLLVSPDGKYVAAVHGGRVFAGTVAEGPARAIGHDAGPAFGGEAAGAPGGAGGEGVGVPGLPGAGDFPPDGGSAPRMPGSMSPFSGPPVIGEPAWYTGAPVVYWAGGDGRLRRCRMGGSPGGLATETLPLAGDAPAPVPGAPEKLVFVRSRPTPKVEAPGGGTAPDPAEIVLRDLGAGSERVLIPAGRAAWRHPVVSPDGSRLALASDMGNEEKPHPLWRVFVLELAGGEPKPVTPFGHLAGPPCWTPDSAGLVYARHARPIPPDHWEESRAGAFAGCELFHLELATGREARLSRGGGFFSPSVDGAGHLYYLTQRGEGAKSVLTLRRMPLAAARTFAEKELDRPARTVAAWQKLADRVLAEAGLAADADGAKITPEVVLAKVADAFARAAEELGLSAPASLQDLDRLRAEFLHLNVPAAEQSRLRLVLGAVTGEFLRRHHEATWGLTAGPLVSERDAPPEPDEANPFVEPFNPFAVLFGIDWWSYRDHVVAPAEGRRLVLTNGPAPDKGLVQDLTDPDLARGVELLRAGKAEEGERVLLKLLERGPHRVNRFLALHVGRLLYTHGRLEAVAELMIRHTRRQPFDARKFNLLGLAQLPQKPELAVNNFKSALRCDLTYEPAYLNLAQAYQNANNPTAAAQCLHRYLQLFPAGALARDAQRRLGVLQNTPPGPGAAQGVPGSTP